MRRLALSILVLACVPWLGAGCDSASSEPEPRVAVVATYNIGLAAGYVDYAAQRRPQVVALLGGLDADLVCLQEVWTQADIDAVVAGTAATFPYHHEVFIEDHTIGPPACDEGPLATLRACVEDKCAGVPAGELAGCVTGNCGDEFFANVPGCQVCLAANLGKPFDDIFDACTTGSELYTYSGANGLLMLSKVPLSNPSHLKLDSSLTQRSVLGATATLPRLGAVDFFCTHIAADLSGEISYNGAFGSYEGENVHQIEQIAAFIDAQGTSGAIAVLAGDFNSGPAVAPDLVAELPNASYATLTTAGWTSLTAATDPQCSFCADNHLVADTHDDVLIDHVFVKGLSSTFQTSVTRIGTAAISVDDNGTAVPTHPSDHYGAAVQFDYVP